MKVDEPFDPSIISAESPEGLKFRIARPHDREAIAAMMSERNPDQRFSEVLEKTDREIVTTEKDSGYCLYVAELNGPIAGLCRFYDSKGVATSKKIFSSPEGWYAMGILVNSKFRRRNIARFLSESRVRVLTGLGATEIYSIVDSKNLTSIRMHQKFGYTEMAKGPGFLHIKPESGSGILFRLSI
jgi:ribosomal protein S18 acetylase RimI-like enzyme